MYTAKDFQIDIFISVKDCDIYPELACMMFFS